MHRHNQHDAFITQSNFDFEYINKGVKSIS